MMFQSIFAFEISSDSKNVYFRQGHFRVIAGVASSHDATLHVKAQAMLDAAMLSWSKYIDILGFLAPRNSTTKAIDIYIANTFAYNEETDNYEVLPAFFAGWATSYPSDHTPYFLLNPLLSDEKLKITIAHEFFHMIQYAYFNDFAIDDEKWFQNIWWLEATAMMMEDEVYDDVDEYISFLTPFLMQSYRDVEIYDGSHEYAMVIYAKFIKEKYGFYIIQESLKRYESSGEKGFLAILDDLLKELHNSSIKAMLIEFGRWVYAPQYFFEEGALYPLVQKYSLSEHTRIDKGGIIILQGLHDYAVVSNILYTQAFASMTQKTIAQGEDIVVGNHSSFIVDGVMLKMNQLDQNTFNSYSPFYRYDSLQGKYFWKIGELLLDKDIFIEEILSQGNSYEKEGVRCVSRQKIDL